MWLVERIIFCQIFVSLINTEKNHHSIVKVSATSEKAIRSIWTYDIVYGWIVESKKNQPSTDPENNEKIQETGISKYEQGNMRITVSKIIDSWMSI